MANSVRSLVKMTALVALSGVAALNLMQPPAIAQQASQSDTALKQAEIEKIIRNYLLENPEIIFEAAEVYSQRQAEVAQQMAEDEIRNNLPTLASGSAGFAVGASEEEAELIIVEFFDYHCGFCRRATDFVFDLVDENPDIRLVLQELPVVHQNSEAVALAALLAPNAEGYAELHRVLMETSGVISADDIPGIAKRAGLNYGPWEKRASNSNAKAAAQAKLDVSMELAATLGIDGTPAFIIARPDGSAIKVVSGFNEPAVLKAIQDVRG